MFPGIYEFHWDLGHILFLGAFFTALTVIGTFMLLGALKTWRDFRGRRVEAIRWQGEFHDLPASRRRCRHDVSGRVEQRSCPNGFDCRVCAENERLASRPLPGGDNAAGTIGGFAIHEDCLYHRGHTWVRPEEDGTLTVGLDDFGARLIGRPDGVELPETGTALELNQAAWRMSRAGATVRVLSPVAGTVIETGGPTVGWYLKVRPESAAPNLRHLLRGSEVRCWLLGEIERLEQVLSPGSLGASLADGGQPVKDLPREAPGADWDAVWGEMFLEN